MKLLTREEKKNEKLLALYNRYVDEGMKPQKAAKVARNEVAKK